MRKYRLHYGIFFIASFVLSIAYKSKLTSLIFLTLLLLPLISLLFLVLNYFLFKISLEAKKNVITKNSTYNMKVIVHNRFISPLWPICICGRFPYKKKNAIESNQILINLSSMKKSEIELKCSLKYRGEYLVGVSVVKMYDVFKLFCLTKKINIFDSVVVLPRELEIGEVIGNIEADSEETTSDVYALEKNAFSCIREYRENDNLRSIHWKLSAKQDQLMVKQFECSINTNIMIITDLNGYFPIEEDNVEMTDCVIETMLAINRSLNTQKSDCYNIWYNSLKNEISAMQVTSTEDYRELFSIMAVIPVQTDIVMFEKFLDSYNQYMDKPRSIYYITSQIGNEFVLKLFNSILIKNHDINIVLINTSLQDQSIVESIRANTGIKIWLLDKDNLAKSINSVINL